jgi:hypothetical protein
MVSEQLAGLEPFDFRSSSGCFLRGAACSDSVGDREWVPVVYCADHASRVPSSKHRQRQAPATGKSRRERRAQTERTVTLSVSNVVCSNATCEPTPSDELVRRLIEMAALAIANERAALPYRLKTIRVIHGEVTLTSSGTVDECVGHIEKRCEKGPGPPSGRRCWHGTPSLSQRPV